MVLGGKYYDLFLMKYDRSKFLWGIPVVEGGKNVLPKLPDNIRLCLCCDNLFDYDDPHQWGVLSTDDDGTIFISDIAICIECYEAKVKPQ